MKYISLFSGIGGFELGIQRVMGDKAQCIGFSEIDKFALQVYTHHFPTHTNLGNVTQITEDQIKELVETNGGCDMLVGGFPCTNLTSLARVFKNCNSDGLDGPASGLFWTMKQIIIWIRKYNGNQKLHIIIENNASMKRSNKEIITSELQSCFDYPIYLTPLNGADFGVQARRRIFWTTFELDVSTIVCEQTWGDVLLPVDEVSELNLSEKSIFGYNQYFKNKSSEYCKQLIKIPINYLFEERGIKHPSRWQVFQSFSDSSCPKSYTITRKTDISHIILDKRNDNIIPRRFHSVEIERLFHFPDKWVSGICSLTRCKLLLGNTIIVKKIEFIVKFVPIRI